MGVLKFRHFALMDKAGISAKSNYCRLSVALNSRKKSSAAAGGKRRWFWNSKPQEIFGKNLQKKV